MIKKIKNWLIVLKLPLRDGNLNHDHAVFVSLFTEHKLLVGIEVKQNEDESIT